MEASLGYTKILSNKQNIRGGDWREKGKCIQKVKCEISIRLRNFMAMNIKKYWKEGLNRCLRTNVSNSSVNYCQNVKTNKNHKCPSTGEWMYRYDSYDYNGKLLSYQKEQRTNTQYNMNNFWQQKTGKKPGTTGHKPYSSIYMKLLESTNS